MRHKKIWIDLIHFTWDLLISSQSYSVSGGGSFQINVPWFSSVIHRIYLLTEPPIWSCPIMNLSSGYRTSNDWPSSSGQDFIYVSSSVPSRYTAVFSRGIKLDMGMQAIKPSDRFTLDIPSKPWNIMRFPEIWTMMKRHPYLRSIIFRQVTRLCRSFNF